MKFQSRLLRRCALAGCVLLGGFGAACSDDPIAPDPHPALPKVIRECETNTAEVCGTWTRIASTNQYRAEWAQGSRAIITAVQFDADAVIFTRDDTAGPTLDMLARYVGVMDGKAVKAGAVEWRSGGLTITGSWRAEW